MRNAIQTIVKPEVQELFDSFSACFGVRIAYYTTDGLELNVGLKRGASRFCKLIGKQLDCRQTCIDHDRMRCREAFEKRALHAYTCHAGATEAIYPIFVDDTAIGYVMVGQMRNRQTPRSAIMKEWEARFPRQELEDAFLDMPSFDENQLKHVLKLFDALVKYIVGENMVTLKGNVMVEKVLDFMRTHVHDRITLEAAAKLVHKSPSTVSHLFKSVTGRSFKETLIRMKLDRADQLLASDPDITVAEVAGRLAYYDQFYFSRVYKKYRGYPPSRRGEG